MIRVEWSKRTRVVATITSRVQWSISTRVVATITSRVERSISTRVVATITSRVQRSITSICRRIQRTIRFLRTVPIIARVPLSLVSEVISHGDQVTLTWVVSPASIRSISWIEATVSLVSRVESSLITRVEPAASLTTKHTGDGWILGEEVWTGSGGAAGESSLVPEGVALVAHVGGGASWLTNLSRNNPTLLIRNILTLSPVNTYLETDIYYGYILLWYVHAEFNIFLLLAHNFVEDVFALGRSAVGTFVISLGEGLTELLGNIAEAALPGHK